MEPIKQSEDIPVSFPVVKVLGKEYALRFTAGAGMRLIRRGIDPSKLTIIAKEWRESGRAMDLVFEMMAAMLGEEVNGRWKPIGLSGEELADQYTMKDFAELTAAVTQAVKALPVASKAETAPASETPQVQ